MAEVLNALYVGTFATDATAKTYINSTQFYTDNGFKNAADVPWTAMFYLNSVIGGYRIWTGAAWDDFGAGSGGVITGIKHVAKNGNDTLGDGSIAKPYLTVQKGITETGAGGSVLVGPGTYTETITILDAVNIEEMVKGTVTISGTVAAGPVVLVQPTTADIIVRISCSIVNLSGAAPAATALHVDNDTLPVGDVLVIFRGETLDGQAAGTGLRVVGDGTNTEVTQVILEGVRDLGGGIICVLEVATDYLRYNNVTFDGGLAAWQTISGTAGRVIIANCLQAAAAANEVINFGNATATGVTLSIVSSVLSGTLNLNNLAGTGSVILSAGAHIAEIVSTQVNQRMQRWLGGDDILLSLYRVDANAVDATIIYTPPVGQFISPYQARTINTIIGGATGVTLNYQYNGTGAQSVVAAVGVAAIAAGVVNETVVQDWFSNATPLTFEIIAGSGVAGERISVEVVAKVS